MAQTPLGNLGLNYEHTLGVDDWKNSYDANWVISDSLGGQAYILDFTITAEPVSPAVGDAYIMAATQTGTNWGTDTGAVPDAIALYTNVPGQTDSSPWLYLTPREGWRVYDRTNNRLFVFDGTNWVGAEKVAFSVALSDLTTALTTGTNKAYFRAPFAFTITSVRSSLLTASTTGLVTVDINDGGTTILSTKLTIDATEKTSVTAAAAAVISDADIADDAEVGFDIDVAGTSADAAGLIVLIQGYRV